MRLAATLRKLFPKETVAMALGSVLAHKFRSFLTVLGIVIGVATVVAVASLLTGLRNNVVRLVEEYGTNNIYAFHLSGGFGGPEPEQERTRKPLRREDADAILAQAPAVDAVASQLFVGFVDRTLNYGGNTYKQGNLQAVTANYATIANIEIREGRFFNEVDDLHKRNVMVVGINVADALFPNRASVAGTQVKMGGDIFEIVGVMEKRKGNFFGENQEDNSIYVPYETGHKLSPRSEWMLLIARAKTGRIPEALEQMRETLRRQRGVKFNDPDNFDLSTADKFISDFDSITALIGLIAIAISAVGLLVGGIGVMNIMLVSVTERTQEIGVRKALGARRRDIVLQFLYEAMALTFLGGALGVGLAVGVGQIIMLLLPSLPATIPLWAIAAALFTSVAIGLVFGVWPARKAARLDPIECLRYE
jgi:putative ABC transport system permease protein